MRIVVRDTPAPQGSKRHVGRGVMVEMSKNVKPWREAVRQEAVWTLFAAQKVAPLSGPVRCWVTFTVRKPASAPKGRKTWPAKRPDVDKLLRSTLDALGSAGVWLDDAQVVDVRGVKVYPGEGDDALEVPGAVIDVEAITEPGEVWGISRGPGLAVQISRSEEAARKYAASPIGGGAVVVARNGVWEEA